MKSAKIKIDYSEAEEATEEAADVLAEHPDEHCAATQFDEAEFWKHIDEIEVVDGKTFDATFYDFGGDGPAYVSHNIEPLADGISYTFKGDILGYCEKFSVNFMLLNKDEDIALHVNPRLPQNFIVRNTRVGNRWGKEEIASSLPFKLERGGTFNIQILVTHDCYLISVNGQHFAQYEHRIPFAHVKGIEVHGHVDNVEAERLLITEYPTRLSDTPPPEIPDFEDESSSDSEMSEPTLFTDEPNPEGSLYSYIERISSVYELAGTKTLLAQKSQEEVKYDRGLAWPPVPLGPPKDAKTVKRTELTELPMPFYGRLSHKGLPLGTRLKIYGRVKLLPSSFYINLQKGARFWPHPIIAFHFNLRTPNMSGSNIEKDIICRNAWIHGKWGKEERSLIDTALRPGRTFLLTIECVDDSYRVLINNKLIIRFAHRVEPSLVDTVYIQGDIKIWKLRVESLSKLNRVEEINLGL